MSQNVKGQRLQCVTGKDSGRLVIGTVTAGLAASQVIVVHGRQVIVDQRVGMDQFNRCRRCVECFRVGANGPPTGVDQGGANAFATAQHGVTHGLVQTGGVGGRGRQPLIEAGFQPRAADRKKGLDCGFRHLRR